jgi:hypothetical protein
MSRRLGVVNMLFQWRSEMYTCQTSCINGESKSLFGEEIPGSAQKVPGSSENREFPRKAALDHQPAIWKGCFLPTRYCDNLS